MEPIYNRFAIGDILTFIASFPQRPLSVAFQFPDDELAYAPIVLNTVKNALRQGEVDGVDVFLLGDTSYAACCVDEVAAAHINANALVHFGHTCFSPPESLPVLYVLGNKHLDTGIDILNCAATIASKLTNAISEDRIVGIVWDPDCTVLLPQIFEGINCILGSNVRDFTPELVFTESSWYLQHSTPHEALILPQIPKAFFPRSGVAKISNDLSGSEKVTLEPNTVKICGLEFPLHLDTEKLELLYLGDKSYRCQAIVAEYSPLSITMINPQDGGQTPLAPTGVRLLTSRYGLVDRIKGADSIGIVAGTLAVAHHSELINTLREGLKAAGKGVYTLCVGRINTPKLANFSTDVEAFVLVACPEAVMSLNSADHILPIASPYEAMLALHELATEAEEEYYYDNDEKASPESLNAVNKDSLSWEGKIDLSLPSLLRKWQDSNIKARLLIRQTQDVAPHFSLSTGKLSTTNHMYSLGREDGNMDSDEDENNGDSPKSDVNTQPGVLVDIKKNHSDVLTLLSGTAGSVAARKLVTKRQWRGLQYERGTTTEQTTESGGVYNSCTDIIVTENKYEPQYSRSDLSIIQGQIGVAQGYADVGDTSRMK